MGKSTINGHFKISVAMLNYQRVTSQSLNCSIFRFQERRSPVGGQLSVRYLGRQPWVNVFAPTVNRLKKQPGVPENRSKAENHNPTETDLVDVCSRRPDKPWTIRILPRGGFRATSRVWGSNLDKCHVILVQRSTPLYSCSIDDVHRPILDGVIANISNISHGLYSTNRFW